MMTGATMINLIAVSAPMQNIHMSTPTKMVPNSCILMKPITVAQQMQSLRQANLIKPEPIDVEPETLRCKRRINFGKLTQVARRNERERNRVKQVNLGFATLRQHVPNGVKKSKKLSKVDTLKSAVSYIKYLRDMIHEHDETMSTSSASSTPASCQMDMADFATMYLAEQLTGDSSHMLSPSPSNSSYDSSSSGSVVGPEEADLLDFSWFQ